MCAIHYFQVIKPVFGVQNVRFNFLAVEAKKKINLQI